MAVWFTTEVRVEGLAGRGGAWRDEAVVEETCGFAAAVVAPGEEVIAAHEASLASRSV